ncbi:hypothetical protein PYCC9005_005375 [Savitreella phatthalungensis]
MSRMANRTLFVKNLPFDISSHEVFELFGRYGAIRQIRLGDAQATKGTAFIVYEEVNDAKKAHDKLAGFNLKGRYLVLLFHKKPDNLETRAKAIEDMKAQYNVT